MSAPEEQSGPGAEGESGGLSAAAERSSRPLHEEMERLRLGVEEMRDERLSSLERRIEAVEQERRYAEWRVYANTEAILNGLLHELRTIADLLSRIP